ncbi:MAG: outer membrane protein assembly factor BamD [bacterium]
MKISGTIIKLSLWLVVASLALSCGGYSIKKNITAAERFELAKRMFNNKDYFEAKTQFKILTLNNPAANFIDAAQFYLAECHFHLKEYIIAADEYNRLERLYTKSEYLDDAGFKIGVCDYKLSPKPALDQKYTLEAVKHFQQFLEDFPDSDLVPEAERLLLICRTKLAEKDFKAGQLYRKLHNYTAALVYFDSVLNQYYDTKFADDALYWKGECLLKLRRIDESLATFNGLMAKFPTSKYRSKTKDRIARIHTKYKINQAADGEAVIGNHTKN